MSPVKAGFKCLNVRFELVEFEIFLLKTFNIKEISFQFEPHFININTEK